MGLIGTYYSIDFGDGLAPNIRYPLPDSLLTCSDMLSHIAEITHTLKLGYINILS